VKASEALAPLPAVVVTRGSQVAASVAAEAAASFADLIGASSEVLGVGS
jgi:hypothetical protein